MMQTSLSLSSSLASKVALQFDGHTAAGTALLPIALHPGLLNCLSTLPFKRLFAG